MIIKKILLNKNKTKLNKKLKKVIKSKKILLMKKIKNY